MQAFIWETNESGLFVGCLTSQQHASVSQGTDLLRQFYVPLHWDTSCRPNFPPHPVTVHWHRANHSQHWPCNARRLAGQPLECQFLSHWYDSTPEKSRRRRDSNSGSSAIEANALTTRPTRRFNKSGTPVNNTWDAAGRCASSERSHTDTRLEHPTALQQAYFTCVSPVNNTWHAAWRCAPKERYTAGASNSTAAGILHLCLTCKQHITCSMKVRMKWEITHKHTAGASNSTAAGILNVTRTRAVWGLICPSNQVTSHS